MIVGRGILCTEVFAAAHIYIQFRTVDQQKGLEQLRQLTVETVDS